MHQIFWFRSKVSNIPFQNINDKIISAGEDSKIYINEIIGKNSYAGIVSKDGSKVYSSDINFDGVKIPFAAYQKKNEYDYPMLNTKNYVVKNSIVTSIKDPTSNLNIKDDILIVNSEKILPIMYEKKILLINKYMKKIKRFERKWILYKRDPLQLVNSIRSKLFLNSFSSKKSKFIYLIHKTSLQLKNLDGISNKKSKIKMVWQTR